MANNAKAEKSGYKKPPKGTRFKKGQSGNPNGRPKKQPVSSFTDAILDELGVEVEIIANGRRQKINMQQVVAKKLVNEAASGKLAAIKAITQQLEKVPQKKSIPKIILNCGPDREEENRRKIEESMKQRAADPNSSEKT